MTADQEVTHTAQEAEMTETLTDGPDYKGFTNAIMKDWQEHGDIDAGTKFDLAVKYRILREIPGGYDPETCDDPACVCPEPGDPWYEWNRRAAATADDLRAAENRISEWLSARVEEAEMDMQEDGKDNAVTGHQSDPNDYEIAVSLPDAKVILAALSQPADDLRVAAIVALASVDALMSGMPITDAQKAQSDALARAASFASEAYRQGYDHDQATHAMLRAFLTALVDPLHTDLDYLRADPAAAFRKATFSKGRTVGGICGQTIDAMMASTMHEVSALNLEQGACALETLAAENAALCEKLEAAEAERDEARAQAAAGFMAGRDAAAEAGGIWLGFNSEGDPNGDYCTVEAYDPGDMTLWISRDRIRALTPPSDHTAALSALLDAELERAAQVCDEFAVGYARQKAAVFALTDAARDIRALRRTPKEPAP